MFRIIQHKKFARYGPVTVSAIMRMALPVFALCLFMAPVIAQPVTELYNTANQFYKKGRFDTAALNYEKILAQGYKIPEVYYNLGNCYYKMDKLGSSILNYERALKLTPQDEDIQHNLKIADARVVDKIIPVPQLGIILKWNSLIATNSSRGWSIWAIGLIWLAFLFFAVYLFTGLRRFSFSLGVLLVLLSVAFMSLSYKQNEKEQESDTAVLMVPNSFVKSAPDANGNDLFMLHEGIKFQLLDRVGEWTKIRLADGKVGWVEKSSFEKI